MSLNLGLLLCDHVRPEFLYLGGDYPEYFARFLPQAVMTTFDLTAGEFPQVDQCAAWITTGSRYSVYDEVGWIEQFAELMRKLDRARTKTVGICFGAQMMVHALGGTVERSDRGWQVGIKEATPVGAGDLLGSETFRIIHSNADQMVQLPSSMRLLATSLKNPVEAIAVGEHFLGLQGHPEFTAEYARALLTARRGSLIPEEVADDGLRSLEQVPDRDRLAEIVWRFVSEQ
jgi:GMP synthase-like glutamine amidotransferase